MNLLLLAQTPPPIHGASIINKAVLDLVSNRDEFHVTHVNISISKSILDMQKSQLLKALKSLRIFFSCCCTIFCSPNKITYINASPSGAASIRDLLFVLLASFRSKIVFAHFHGQMNDDSVFSRITNQRFLKKNVSYIFLDQELVPNSLKQKKNSYILYNYVPGEKDYLSIEKDNNEIPVVCFLANMLPAKGVVDFLEICADSLRAGYKFKVIIAGGWTSKYQQENYIEWLQDNDDISSMFNHCGNVDHKEKLEFFSRADIFLYPTKNDAFPLVILEAMASGVITIASNVGAIKNIIGDDSLVCDPNDTDEFRSTLEKFILDDSLRSVKKEELKRRYKENFSKSKFEEGLLSILRYQ